MQTILKKNIFSQHVCSILTNEVSIKRFLRKNLKMFLNKLNYDETKKNIKSLRCGEPTHIFLRNLRRFAFYMRRTTKSLRFGVTCQYTCRDFFQK